MATLVYETWQLMCIANSNLLPAQNVLKIYASEIKSCTSHHVEHNAAIGIQIGYHMKEIKYLLKKLHVGKKNLDKTFVRTVVQK